MTSEPQWPRFSSHVVEQLAHANDIDDQVDPDVSLPDRVECHVDDDDVRQCYALGLAYWEQGVSRDALLSFCQRIIAGEVLSQADMAEFKQIRARYKLMRFAQRLYSTSHAVNKVFGLTTVTMGKLQDAYKNGQHQEVKRFAKRLRWLVSRPVWGYVHHTITHVKLASARDVCAVRRKRLEHIAWVARQTQLGGKTFHNTRKVISQQVAHYGIYHTLNPDNATIYQIFRFLSAINGLMGDKHDEIVAGAIAGEHRYDDQVKIADDLAWRLKRVAHSFVPDAS